MHPHITVLPSNGVLFHISIPTVELEAVVGHSIGHLADPVFGHGNFSYNLLPCHMVSDQVIYKYPSNFYFCSHFSDFKRVMLELSNRLAKSLPGLDISDRIS